MQATPLRSGALSRRIARILSIDFVLPVAAGLVWAAGMVRAEDPPPPIHQARPTVPGHATAWEGSTSVSPYSSVSMYHGNLITEIPLVGWSGLGPDIDFRIYHNSGDGEWRYSYSRKIEIISDLKAYYVRDDGRKILFERRGVEEGWTCEQGFFLELEDSTDPDCNDDWCIKSKNQWRMEFEENGPGTEAELTKVIDSAGNELTISGNIPYDMIVTDAAGRKLRTETTGAAPFWFMAVRDCQIGANPADQNCDTGRAWIISLSPLTKLNNLNL